MEQLFMNGMTRFPTPGNFIGLLKGNITNFPRSKLKSYHFVHMYPYIVSLLFFFDFVNFMPFWPCRDLDPQVSQANVVDLDRGGVGFSEEKKM